jgi:hypothetical protein
VATPRIAAVFPETRRTTSVDVAPSAIRRPISSRIQIELSNMTDNQSPNSRLLGDATNDRIFHILTTRSRNPHFSYRRRACLFSFMTISPTYLTLRFVNHANVSFFIKELILRPLYSRCTNMIPTNPYRFGSKIAGLVPIQATVKPQGTESISAMNTTALLETSHCRILLELNLVEVCLKKSLTRESSFNTISRSS